MRVAIVGCGITGASCAYFLAKDGHEVHVFEKNSTFGGNVLKSSALVWHIREPPQTKDWNIEETTIYLTHQLIMHIVHTMKKDIKFQPLPTLGVIHNDEQLEQAKKDVEGNPCARIISLEEGLKINPHFSKKIKGFVMWDKAYAADPYLTVQCLVNDAKSRGANFRFHTQVVRISQDRTVTWETSGERKWDKFDKIIVASGCRISKLMEQIGISIPVFPVHGQMFTIRPPKDFRLNCFLSSFEKNHTMKKIGGLTVTHTYFGGKRRFRHLYGRQRLTKSGKPGPLIFGGDRIIGELGFDPIESHESVRQHICEIFPILRENFTYRGKWFGVMPWTQDERPVLGEVRDGIWVASGLQAHGFGLGLGAAQLVVESLLGNTNDVLKQADPFRFATKKQHAKL